MKGFDEKKKVMEYTHSSIKKKRRLLYILLLVILAAMIAVYFLLPRTGGETVSDVLSDLIYNIIGIFIPLIIFDYLDNRLTGEENAIEMSVRITNALMSDPETMDLFTPEQKVNFVHSTLESMAGDSDLSDLLENLVDGVTQDRIYHRIRTSFQYTMNLMSGNLKSFQKILGDPGNYFLVQEILTYTVKDLRGTQKDRNENQQRAWGREAELSKRDLKLTREYRIGFTFDTSELDSMLRKEDTQDLKGCIFREDLELDLSDLQQIQRLENELGKEKFMSWFMSSFRVTLKVDNQTGIISDISLKRTGIICTFLIDNIEDSDTHDINILFYMPKKINSILEVVFTDPTRGAHINLNYDEENMKVEMFPFMNRSERTSVIGSHVEKMGVYDIGLSHDEWVLPISGVAFHVKKITP